MAPISISLQPSDRSWGLGHIAQASKAKPTSLTPTTKTGTSPSAVTVVGDSGLRGNQVAPAPNINPKSTLNLQIDQSIQGISENPLFGAEDDLMAASFSSLSDLVTNFTDAGSEGFDAVSLPSELNSLEKEAPLQDTSGGSISDVQKSFGEVGKNGLTVKIQLPKESKTSQNTKQSTGDSNVNQEKKQTDKVLKASKAKKEMDGAKSKKSTEKEGVITNGFASKARNKAELEKGSESNGKKGNKKKTEVKAEPKVSNGQTTVKSAKDDEEDIFVDIESDVGNPLLDGTRITDTKVRSKNTVKNRTTVPKLQKNSSKITNGISIDNSEHHNGEKLSPSLVSPSRRKNGLTSDENTLNGYSKPDSLLVKIDLSLLKRVPRLQGSDQSVVSRLFFHSC